jgi:hypothetical protein
MPPLSLTALPQLLGFHPEALRDLSDACVLALQLESRPCLDVATTAVGLDVLPQPESVRPDLGDGLRK